MSDLPTKVHIHEEGPREGFQIEPGPIPTARKIELIDALSETGLQKIQVASFVSPKAVPGWADADEVVKGFKRKPGVKYHVLWLNEKGLQRALMHQADGAGLHMFGSISTTASETFMRKNTNRGYEDNIRVQGNQIRLYQENNIPVVRASIMTAFGCNYEGPVAIETVLKRLAEILALADEMGCAIEYVSLADTMGWANPSSVKRLVGAVRDKWPELGINLHLHDTRGLGIANAYAGIQMGVTEFDSAVAGLGGCPFAALKGAAGNVCTEDLVFLCEEMGIDTGVDLDRLVEVAQLAEDIVGHPLAGSIMHAGTLTEARAKAKAA